MNDGLRLALRFNPETIVPSEMRGAEALTAVESGRTGHPIVSTLHANSAYAAYDRILSMCQMAETRLSESQLLKQIVEAIPIMVFKEKLPDGSRKYMEIYEATGVENGVVTGQAIFRYELEKYERGEDGAVIKAHGFHRQVGTISSALAQYLFIKGAEKEILDRYTKVQKTEEDMSS